MITGSFIALFALIGVIAIIVWLVQWANGSRRSHIALDILNERFARREIDRAEYEEKRSLNWWLGAWILPRRFPSPSSAASVPAVA